VPGRQGAKLAYFHTFVHVRGSKKNTYQMNNTRNSTEDRTEQEGRTTSLHFVGEEIMRGPANRDTPRRSEEPMIALSPTMVELGRLVDLFAPSSLPILVLGETGTGKEVVADRIQQRSRRNDAPFIKVNCASIAEGLLESELFGHERGAFTGASVSHRGIFEAADGGTLFLDELGELSLRAQAKLLRVLESGELTRVGSTQRLDIDVRVIAATHRDLADLVRQRAFREDLYFRLSGVTLFIRKPLTPSLGA
jgi:transcriptional regulator with GAF, ATPase, and Fis domain